ncbi:hypothetical protein F971_01966 [Acinetobacter vivianii]|uniref:Uncharacterized protein n=1 Tax=Acinetobacter vivianii TaxID=1776742 RepID=N8WAX2_9GAMM|nr:hypothetical protein [Acinetobacter vivianii]ENU92079.1 hypothetical protein F971_01966 [Acinetobacter vivianii]
MQDTLDKAKRIIEALAVDPKSVNNVKTLEGLDNDTDEWNNVSSEAYRLFLQQERQARDIDEKTPNIGCTSNEEIKRLLAVNTLLSNYALTIPTLSTMHDFHQIEELSRRLPESEHEIITLISPKTIHPSFRAQQKLGRFEVLPPFREFALLIESAVLSFYRSNFIGAYLTLCPVIEGIISRWIGFTGEGKKPTFLELKNFFRNGHLRNPCPGNVLFYDVFSQACDKLLTDHFYKSSTQGDAYSNFNRHLAAHLLKNEKFATKDNCIRLFLILDTMTEIYIYETYHPDARFYLTDIDIGPTQQLYIQALSVFEHTPETILLNKIQ